MSSVMTFGVSAGAKICFMSKRDRVICKAVGRKSIDCMNDGGGHVNLHFIFVDLGVN